MEILLIDDHALFRDGLSYVLKQLSEGVTLHGAKDEAKAISVIENYPALDLVLLDLILGDSDGLDTLLVLRDLAPEIPIVVISAMEEPVIIKQALDSGAMGYIPKSSKSAVMLNAIRLVMSGGIYVPPLMVTTRENPTNKEPAAENNLTLRQMEVLALMAKGLTNNQIASTLSLGETTIKTHVSAILKSLQVDNRTQAVVIARKKGLIGRY